MSFYKKTCLLAALLFCQNTAMAAPKNIIYMIGDGMGPNYLTAFRYWHTQTTDNPVKQTVFDSIWKGVAMTYPKDKTFVTDSAAAATALATHYKSYNGAISVDHDHNSLYTLMESANNKGKKTGLVVTSQITHATPASFFAHQKHRKEYPQIADQIVDNRINNKPVMDLLLGGGQNDLIREDRNILNELSELGYQTQTDFTQLDQLSSLPAIGVFHPVAFPSAIDSDKQRLADMTGKALDLLNSSEDGFVLLIEGSQIDWCGHANDIACAMAEMQDFANALKVVIEYTKNNPDTLVVVTADHETGGMSLGANNQYQWLPNIIAQVHSSSKTISKSLAEANNVPVDIAKAWQKHVDFVLEQDELIAFTQIKSNKSLNDDQKFSQLDKQVKKIINNRSYTGWTSGGHTALDVPVLAYGKNSDLFSGFQNNTDIAKKLLQLIK